MVDILEQSALTLSGMLDRRVVSHAEVMQATLARIDAANPAVNAVVALRNPDQLNAAARQADTGPRASWLHGLPIAVKDLAPTVDVVTTFGSPLFKAFKPTANDIMVQRMLDAGAILIGKTNVPEFGLGSHSYNPVYGTTVNPYDHSRAAGGSSGGAAVALATRMLPLADGSDMMGSLRNPAAWNNVYGHRPTSGMIPGGFGLDLFLHPLATAGPMARDPRDMAALLAIQAGPHPASPDGVAFDTSSANGPLPTDLRIGWLGDWGGAWAMEPGLLERGQYALKVLETLGCHVDPIVPPFSADAIWTSWTRLRSWAVAAANAALYADPKSRAVLKPALIWEIEQGQALSNAEILEASALRSDWFRAAAQAFETYDVLAMPATQVWPFPADWTWPKEIAGRSMDTYHRWMECVVPVSLLGLPATALPAGFGPSGLPAGIQITGPRGTDAALLRLASAYHEATNWPGARPPTLP